MRVDYFPKENENDIRKDNDNSNTWRYTANNEI